VGGRSKKQRYRRIIIGRLSPRGHLAPRSELPAWQQPIKPATFRVFVPYVADLLRSIGYHLNRTVAGFAILQVLDVIAVDCVFSV
jgi:hypothetical protein